MSATAETPLSSSPRYLDPESTQTLAEGLEEFYSLHPAFKRGDQLTTEDEKLFGRHDACHVIFGLETHLLDESLADFRTMLQTDVGWIRYAQYLNTPEAMNILKSVKVGAVLRALLRSVWPLTRVLWNKIHQPQRLPWEHLLEMKNKTLKEIRQEYGIQIFPRRAP